MWIKEKVKRELQLPLKKGKYPLVNIMRFIRKALLILILPLFIATCGSAFARSASISSTEITAAKGTQWRCKRCGGFNYSEAADWEGNYYCAKCGAIKGDG
ncbi:MAG: hypothetical protein WCF65_02330 [Parachlamydiaceae bacterium]